MGSSLKITLVMILVSFYIFSSVSSTEFDVGGEDGWIVPKSKTLGDMFNKWASENRFQVNDTLRFKSKEDSVLEVTEEEYKKCKATKPLFYSNNETAVIPLNRSGLFYFISGISGHCEKGQKMIIKVMETESEHDSPPHSPPPSSSSSSSSSSPPSSSSLPASTPKKSNALKTAAGFSSSGFVVFAILVVSVL